LFVVSYSHFFANITNFSFSWDQHDFISFIKDPKLWNHY